MSEHIDTVVPRTRRTRSRIAPYVTGYILSIYLTLSAYLLVRRHLLARTPLIAMVVGLALAQFIVQLLFFLHLGSDSKPRWRLFVFLLMLLVVSILVFGSLWIMTNLNYRMTPQQVNTYMNGQDSL